MQGEEVLRELEQGRTRRGNRRLECRGDSAGRAVDGRRARQMGPRRRRQHRQRPCWPRSSESRRGISGRAHIAGSRLAAPRSGFCQRRGGQAIRTCRPCAGTSAGRSDRDRRQEGRSQATACRPGECGQEGQDHGAELTDRRGLGRRGGMAGREAEQPDWLRGMLTLSKQIPNIPTTRGGSGVARAEEVSAAGCRCHLTASGCGFQPQ